MRSIFDVVAAVGALSGPGEGGEGLGTGEVVEAGREEAVRIWL